MSQTAILTLEFSTTSFSYLKRPRRSSLTLCDPPIWRATFFGGAPLVPFFLIGILFGPQTAVLIPDFFSWSRFFYSKELGGQIWSYPILHLGGWLWSIPLITSFDWRPPCVLNSPFDQEFFVTSIFFPQTTSVRSVLIRCIISDDTFGDEVGNLFDWMPPYVPKSHTDPRIFRHLAIGPQTTSEVRFDLIRYTIWRVLWGGDD